MLGEIQADLPDLFDNLNFEDLLADVPEIEPYVGETDPDEVPEPVAEPVIRLGDLVLLGRHRLLCGDSCKVGDVDRLMDGKLATCTYQDPPSPIDNDHKSVAEMKQFWTDTFTLTATHLKPGGSYYFSSPQGGELMMMMSIIDAGLVLKHMLIWVKNNHVLGRCDYNYKHEPILYGWKPGAGHKFYGGGGEVSVWEIPKPQKSDLHPTMKPVELIERAIKNSSKVGDIVLDPFLGSGTTIIACEHLGRICYSMEISPAYVEVSLRRWINYTGKPDEVKVIRGGKEYGWAELQSM